MGHLEQYPSRRGHSQHLTNLCNMKAGWHNGVCQGLRPYSQHQMHPLALARVLLRLASRQLPARPLSRSIMHPLEPVDSDNPVCVCVCGYYYTRVYV